MVGAAPRHTGKSADQTTKLSTRHPFHVMSGVLDALTHFPCLMGVVPWRAADGTVSRYRPGRAGHRSGHLHPRAAEDRRRWPPASISSTQPTRAPRGSITNLPTPYRRGWHPSKSGVAQSTGTSHQRHQMPDRPGPAATNRWPLLSTRHSTYPRTDQDAWTSREQSKKTAPQLFSAA